MEWRGGGCRGGRRTLTRPPTLDYTGWFLSLSPPLTNPLQCRMTVSVRAFSCRCLSPNVRKDTLKAETSATWTERRRQLWEPQQELGGRGKPRDENISVRLNLYNTSPAACVHAHIPTLTLCCASLFLQCERGKKKRRLLRLESLTRFPDNRARGNKHGYACAVGSH